MIKELNCKWHFALSMGGQEQGPNEAMSETFKKVPYDALVRESVQNSLDAVEDKTKPVVMDFSFGSVNHLDYPEFYVLKDHINGCIQKYNNDIARKKFQPMSHHITTNNTSLTYLCVSDSNTSGMPYTKGDTESPFYSFVKCAGNSVKSTSDSGGSFGFGKAAYFNVSKIRALLVSSLTSAGNHYFEGVASLCTHKLNNTGNYQPVGYYCDSDSEEPISDANNIPYDFRRTEAGTSVYIMGIDLQDMSKADISLEIARAVILNFWCAILHKRLVVKINGNIELNSENIEQMAAKYFPDSDEDPKYARTRNPRPYLEAVAQADSDSHHIKYKKQLPILGMCTLYVLKKRTGTDNVLYMRSPRMLVYNDKMRTNYGFYGVFICQNEVGNKLLKDIEDPSHSEWDWKRIPTEYRIMRNRARNAMTEIRDFIQTALEEIFAAAAVDHIDIKGTENYTYIPTEYDESNSDSEQTSVNGTPTGIFLDEGTSMTTDINTPPTGGDLPKESNTAGELIIKTSKNAKPDPKGKLQSGHGDKPRKNHNTGRPQLPGDRKQRNSESNDGAKGYFATEIKVPYRTFSQIEDGVVVHYVVFRAESEVEKVQIRFFSVGEEGEEPLPLYSADGGTIDGNLLSDYSLHDGTNRLRVRFRDNMKHSINLVTEELTEQ